MSILEISKTLIYDFWSNYIKPKYRNDVKLCRRDTDSLIIRIKFEDVYEDIVDDVKKQLDTSNYQVECNTIDRPLPTGNNKRSDWVSER